MRLVYYSSVLNHHQKCLCDEFYMHYGDDFAFITTMEMEKQRLDLGYKPETAPYLFESFRSEENRKRAIQMAIECDALLAGVFPTEVLHERMKQNRLTFRHIETYFKSGKYKLLSPNSIRIAYTEHTRYRDKPLYLLCASSHTASDVKLFGGYPDKKLKWGYFPEMVLSKTPVKTEKRDTTELLWAGRLIRWKKPDYALRVVADLSKRGQAVHLSLIGTGPLEQQLKDMAKNLQIEQAVTFCGSMPPAEVRAHMENADIFLFTSTREEGWGAVLNEAMSSSCAIVASAEAGSTNYLIPDEQYGLKYANNRYDLLLVAAERLCTDKVLADRLKSNAGKRICELWNYKVAAQRFIEISEGLLRGENSVYTDDGPMSKG